MKNALLKYNNKSNFKACLKCPIKLIKTSINTESIEYFTDLKIIAFERLNFKISQWMYFNKDKYFWYQIKLVLRARLILKSR